jgi:hypothetical protein
MRAIWRACVLLGFDEAGNTSCAIRGSVSAGETFGVDVVACHTGASLSNESVGTCGQTCGLVKEERGLARGAGDRAFFTI